MVYLCNTKQINIFVMSKIFKGRMKQLMGRTSMWQADLADYCRKSRQTVSNWCNIPAGSSSKIPRMAMRDICEFFGCKPSDLITDTSELAAHVSAQNSNRIYKAVV